MKVGFITEPNNKGQIVIPKEMRTALGIKPGTLLNLVARGSGLYIYPVNDQLKDTSKKRRALELAASSGISLQP